MAQFIALTYTAICLVNPTRELDVGLIKNQYANNLAAVYLGEGFVNAVRQRQNCPDGLRGIDRHHGGGS